MSGTRTSKPDTVVGIDPDCERSGVAILDVADRRLDVCAKTFPELLDYLRQLAAAGANVKIVVEAGWMVAKSNYHPAQGLRAEKIAKDVGANHETGRKIIEMCRHYGLQAVAVHPLNKCWRGRNGKITAKELEIVTGYGRRTNQDGRDAALLAWVHAGLPIRLGEWNKNNFIPQNSV